jgi:hypothetical protein
MSTVEIARELLSEALAPHFSNGKVGQAKLEQATQDALTSISHLITVRDDVKKKRLGATVMTQESSMARNRPGSAPRTL